VRAAAACSSGWVQILRQFRFNLVSILNLDLVLYSSAISIWSAV
jgi:hypothetical protein